MRKNALQKARIVAQLIYIASRAVKCINDVPVAPIRRAANPNSRRRGIAQRILCAQRPRDRYEQDGPNQRSIPERH
jgi:hypothetical protein